MKTLTTPVIEDQEPFKKGLFERVDSYQKKVVLLMGFAYAFGYASRAIHAFEYNLGTLPGVRFDYLVAGTLLLIPPVALCLIFWGGWRSAKHLAAWAVKVPQRKARVSNALVGTFVLPMFLILFPWDRVKKVGIVFVLCGFLYYLMFLRAVDKSSSSLDATSESANVQGWRKVLSRLGHGALYLWGALIAFQLGLLLVLIFVLAAGYGSFALKHVPQEFGGVKPKCGILDLAPEELSPELRSSIATSTEPLAQASKIVRSRPLEVFTTSEPWLIRLPGTAEGMPPRSIRLNGKAVLSVEWCR